jgi:hypothetical protein
MSALLYRKLESAAGAGGGHQTKPIPTYIDFDDEMFMKTGNLQTWLTFGFKWGR